MALPQLKEEFYTTDYIYSLRQGERAELIDGIIYSEAPPSPKHQSIVLELATIINNYIKSKGGSCKVFIAPYAVILDKDDYNHLEPDISVICDTSKLTDRGCEGAPDWIIEVVSPSSRQKDYYTKLLKYRKSGVREYWIVDPEKGRITVHNFEGEDITYYTFSETVKASIFEELSIDFSQLPIG